MKQGSIFLAIAFFSACSGEDSTSPPTASEQAERAEVKQLPADSRAIALSRQYLIVDTHIDVPYRLERNPADVSKTTAEGDFDYPRAVAGGLDALFMSIYIPASVDEAGGATDLANKLIDSVEAIAGSAPDKFALATCTADISTIKEQGKIAFPMGMENGGPIAGSLELLDHFRMRGIRYITLAHSKSNHISDSSYDENEPWQGLSPFGKSLVAEMNDRGVMIDVSHISDKAFWQVLELTNVPVVATHSSLRHFTPGFQRNMSDEMVKALGENNGVVQIAFGGSFLTATAGSYRAARQQAAAAYRDAQHLAADDPALVEFFENYGKENPYPFPDIDDVLNHIDRVVEIAGIDHVGLGSDYDGVGDTLPVGLKDVSAYPNLVAGLLGRNYSERDIEKILGANLMRVWQAGEAYAEAHGNPPSCRSTKQVLAEQVSQLVPIDHGP
ncbi:MAG: dipeptidase, partial [Gammaproteobacteria bacterium]|nr:dipeptidase [Gammaproteobacteria bacterium]